MHFIIALLCANEYKIPRPPLPRSSLVPSITSSAFSPSSSNSRPILSPLLMPCITRNQSYRLQRASPVNDTTDSDRLSKFMPDHSHPSSRHSKASDQTDHSSNNVSPVAIVTRARSRRALSSSPESDDSIGPEATRGYSKLTRSRNHPSLRRPKASRKVENNSGLGESRFFVHSLRLGV